MQLMPWSQQQPLPTAARAPQQPGVCPQAAPLPRPHAAHDGVQQQLAKGVDVLPQQRRQADVHRQRAAEVGGQALLADVRQVHERGPAAVGRWAWPGERVCTRTRAGTPCGRQAGSRPHSGHAAGAPGSSPSTPHTAPAGAAQRTGSTAHTPSAACGTARQRSRQRRRPRGPPVHGTHAGARAGDSVGRGPASEGAQRCTGGLPAGPTRQTVPARPPPMQRPASRLTSPPAPRAPLQTRACSRPGGPAPAHTAPAACAGRAPAAGCRAAWRPPGWQSRP